MSRFASAATGSLKQGRKKRRDLCCLYCVSFPLAALLRSLSGRIGRHSECRQIKKELTYLQCAPDHSSTELVQCVVRMQDMRKTWSL